MKNGNWDCIGNDGLDNYIDQVPLLDKKSRGLRNQASLFFAPIYCYIIGGDVMITGSRQEYKMILRTRNMEYVTKELMMNKVSYYVTGDYDIIAYSNNKKKKILTSLGFIRMAQ